MAFKRLPPEWQNEKLAQGLEKISKVASDWFEEAASDNIEDLGFKGVRNTTSIGTNNQRVEIPQEDVGEIDYLGYHESDRLLLIAEHKLVRAASEGKGFRVDISKFTRGDNSYVEKVRRKARWVRQNLRQVASSLNSLGKFDDNVEPEKTAVLICTRYPTIVDYLVDGMPCVSITNFMLDYRRERRWPYSKGLASTS